MEIQKVNEIWRPVAGYEGRYEVSDQGRVRAIRTKRGKKVRYVLKPRTFMCRKSKRYSQLRYKDYYRVLLFNDGKYKNFYIHRLVAAAFLPAPEPGLEIDHINGDKFDNRSANLQWISSSKNKRKSTATNPLNKYLYTLYFKSTEFTYSTYSVADLADRICMNRNTLQGAMWRNGRYENEFIRVTRKPKENAKKNDR